MRLAYALLAPTHGMHQYTADLAGRALAAGHAVHLVTTTGYPTGRYPSAVTVRTPVATRSTFGRDALRARALRDLRFAICESQANAVHFTGPHLWNLPLLWQLRRAGIPTVHTLHDLDPHPGTSYGPLLYLWNRLVARSADHILVHGRRYARRVAKWIGAERVSYTPLLHGFWKVGLQVAGCRLQVGEGASRVKSQVSRVDGFALFFGRLERYKGIDVLLQSQLQRTGGRALLRSSGSALESERRGVSRPRVIIAGKGELARIWDAPLPPGVEVRNRYIDDDEGIDLFRRCGVVVLPYIQATQSALIAAAYVFGKPVIVTDTGALAEYVVLGETGWVVPPNDPAALAAALDEALADPARLRRMGQAGRAWYEKERIAEWETLQAMYARVAGGGC